MNWENETPSQVAERAARRAIEAISRVGTLVRENEALTERVAALESSQRDLMEVVEALMGMIEGAGVASV